MNRIALLVEELSQTKHAFTNGNDDEQATIACLLGLIIIVLFVFFDLFLSWLSVRRPFG